MNLFRQRIIIPSFSIILLGFLSNSTKKVQVENDYYPDSTWMQYVQPEEAGFSNTSVSRARSIYDSLNASSLLMIYRGKVLINWGENTRRMPTASVRKSFLSALIGQKVAEKAIRIDQPIQNFDFPELQKLNSVEQTATIENLLTASSGIYLPAAYETRGWTSQKPARGSYKPGTHWYYNNWDFNTLGAIYDSIADESLARDFQNNIANPIGMEDYRPDMDFKYFYADQISTPAYLFKMSARDMARFGLLYLRNGHWENKEIVQEDWIEKSTSKKITPWEGTGYSYLWWNTSLKNEIPLYYASGTGVQGIYVVPSFDLVMVFRANSYTGPEIGESAEIKLLEALLKDYKQEGELEHPNLAEVNWQKAQIKAGSYQTEEWIGSYSNNIAHKIRILKEGNKLILSTKIADFYMYPQSDSIAWVEDLNVNAVLRSSEKLSNTSHLDANELVVYK